MLLLRRLKLRHRIGLLVALAAAALATTTAVTLVLGDRSEQQLSGIETRYVPLLELDRDLETMSTQITQALADAAAAAEDSRIADADALDRELVNRLRSGAEAIADNGGDAVALEREYRAYFTVAREVTAALVAGTPVVELADRIEAMTRNRTAFATHLDVATAPDRRRLAAAFAAARQSQRDALRIEIVVALSAFALMTLLSWRFIRRTVKSLGDVSRGVQRLARGEFGSEIVVASDDELGDLAREANRTAVRLRDYRDALEERAAELARASRYKSEFLANMSHELRTPLNSIMILSQLLATNADQVLNPKHVEFATLIQRSGEELLALINEVLDLSKVEAGKQTMAFAPVTLASIEDYLRRMFQPLAIQKQLELVVEHGGDLPSEIRTDWARLAQILKNLLANAFKFTAKGGVTVRITRLELASIEVAVTDTGIGIPADKQAWIFEAFAQAETGTARNYGGTGLGLTIARELAMRLGGSLRVESEVGRGSTFRLVLPIAGPATTDGVTADAVAPAAAAAAAVPPRAGPEPAAGPGADPDAGIAGRRVLIVDDDMRNVYALASALGGSLRIVTAADADEAIEELERDPDVDVVVIDVTTPGTDGAAAIRRIRAQPRFASLPILAVTARAGSDERERWLAAGATDQLARPVEVDRLLALLRVLLAGGR